MLSPAFRKEHTFYSLVFKKPLVISANGFAFRGATLSLLTSLRGLNIAATLPLESSPFAPITS
jgi:hypothetical protein